MKKIVGLSLAAMLVLAACGGNEDADIENTGEEIEDPAVEVAAEEEPSGDTPFDPEDYPEVIATVNGEDIQREMFLTHLEQQASMLASQGISLQDEEGAEFLEMLEMQLVEQLVNEQILVQSATDAGIEATMEEVDAEIEQLMAEAGIATEEELEEILAMQNNTTDDLREELMPLVQRNKFLDSQIELPTISEEEIQEVYDAYVASMEGEDVDIPSYEEVRDDIERDLQNQHRQEQSAEILDRLREESEVTINI
ncbi:peptidyl-prolyl cis-trans isomerase SurA [Evansella vedderi]|uniref:Peptidyl-prolyl cis-trans isomerase SurA n=1 Tax=Evansella vedderi TaxID=38282 RepID=A0ABU0A1E8_9BACI|nr:SurA N-terminal domain-containing protein [Evansella vedderi]MDQ0256944.1 peptidyl-prolyl cis-trans isomerase SurA [Evansella vedderi]